MKLTTMNDLEAMVNRAVKLDESLGLFIEMPGFPEAELIVNSVANLEKKLKYWKNTYDENLEHKHAKGIKIVGCVFD